VRSAFYHNIITKHFPLCTIQGGKLSSKGESWNPRPGQNQTGELQPSRRDVFSSSTCCLLLLLPCARKANLSIIDNLSNDWERGELTAGEGLEGGSDVGTLYIGIGCSNSNSNRNRNRRHRHH